VNHFPVRRLPVNHGCVYVVKEPATGNNVWLTQSIDNKSEPVKQTRVGIIGGGISGLAAARELRRRLPHAQIEIIEASSQLGGVLQTEHDGGYLIEHSADMFTVDPPWALELCQQLGHADQLISTQPIRQRAFVATETRIEPVPRAFSLMLPGDVNAVLESSLLDEQSKARFLAERDVPARESDADESLQSFAVRRFGQQVFERLIQPLVSGIYTADPQKLSMQATMARFVAMEREHGSLIAAAEAQQKLNEHEGNTLAFADQTASGARYDLFRAPRAGMGQLVSWLADALTNVRIRLGCAVRAIKRTEFGWEVEADACQSGFESGMSNHGSETQSLKFDGLIITTPTNATAQIIETIDATLAEELSQILAASCAVVVLGFDEAQFSNKFGGYGIVVPACLQRQLIAVSFSSNKFAGRAPDGKVLLRCFVGGAMNGEVVDGDDERLLQLVINELRQLLDVDGSPELFRVLRWKDTMPQYHVGHLDRVSRIENRVAAQPCLELAGNGYRGVGIPVCLKSGQEAAERLAEQIANPMHKKL